MTKAVIPGHNITQGVPHLITHLFVLHFHYSAPLPYLSLPSHMFSLSSLSSHVILSLSLSPSQDQQAGNTSESCDRGAKNTAGVVFASPGTFPANSIKA